MKLKNKLSPLIIISFSVWLVCVLVFAGIIFYAIKFQNETSQVISSSYIITLVASIFLGIASFGVGLIAIDYKIRGKNIRKKSWVLAGTKVIFLLAILPFFLLWDIVQPTALFARIKSVGIVQYWREFEFKIFTAKFLLFWIVAFAILPIWATGYTGIVVFAEEKINLKEEHMNISGTGSMYPTWPKGEGRDPKELSKQVVGTAGIMLYPSGFELFGKRYFSYEIGRGDIITVEDDKTRKVTEEMYGRPGGLLKRVIAVSGDTVELRDGIVYLNDKPLKEPYVASPRSTFGSDFLKECTNVTVPSNSIFIMGDNRKGSGDSRWLGFFSLNDVNRVIPLEKQRGELDKNWHDASHDLDDGSAISLDVNKYVSLLNEKRKEVGLQPLKYQPKLEQSAKLRGDVMLKYADFSFEAEKSGYDIKKAMSDSGYSNVTYGEAPTQGYYTAEELIEHQFEFPDSKKFLLSKDYQEIGIALVHGEMNDCPTQVVVQHFAGYVPPNYKKSDINSWKSTLADLKKIRSSWKDLKKYDTYYEEHKKDIDRINDIISERISNIGRILSRMEANQWLTAEEQGLIEQDRVLLKEQEKLADKLNN